MIFGNLGDGGRWGWTPTYPATEMISYGRTRSTSTTWTPWKHGSSLQCLRITVATILSVSTVTCRTAPSRPSIANGIRREKNIPLQVMLAPSLIPFSFFMVHFSRSRRLFSFRYFRVLAWIMGSIHFRWCKNGAFYYLKNKCLISSLIISLTPCLFNVLMFMFKSRTKNQEDF